MCIYVYMYINYVALAIDPFLGACYCLLPIVYVYGYASSHLPMVMPWAGPMAPAHVLGPLRPPR